MRQRVPPAAEVSVEHLDELGGRDVADVLVGQVGYAHDGALLDGPGHLLILVDAHLPHLIALLLEFCLHDLRVGVHFLNHESRADDVNIVADIVFRFSVLLSAVPHAENVVLLNIPNAAFGERFQCERLRSCVLIYFTHSN